MRIKAFLDRWIRRSFGSRVSIQILKNDNNNDRIPSINPKTTPSTAVHKPITISCTYGLLRVPPFLARIYKLITTHAKPRPIHPHPYTTTIHAHHHAAQSGGKQKNEIFVDILERLNVLFAANGSVVNSAIDGCIQMKSYLSGNPELKLALNSDLVIGKGAPCFFFLYVMMDRVLAYNNRHGTHDKPAVS